MAANLLARSLERLGRPLAQPVDAAMDIGVFGLVESPLGIDNGARLLRARGTVEKHEALAVDLAGEDREVLPDMSDVESLYQADRRDGGHDPIPSESQ